MDPNMAVAGFALIKGDNAARVGSIAGATTDVLGMGPAGIFRLSKSNPRLQGVMMAVLKPAASGRDIEGWA
jgi:hypothetical protein